jgi:hypothetical protein
MLMILLASTLIELAASRSTPFIDNRKESESEKGSGGEYPIFGPTRRRGGRVAGQSKQSSSHTLERALEDWEWA